jgi:hypothetical protein
MRSTFCPLFNYFHVIKFVDGNLLNESETLIQSSLNKSSV